MLSKYLQKSKFVSYAKVKSLGQVNLFDITENIGIFFPLCKKQAWITVVRSPTNDLMSEKVFEVFGCYYSFSSISPLCVTIQSADKKNGEKKISERRVTAVNLSSFSFLIFALFTFQTYWKNNNSIYQNSN